MKDKAKARLGFTILFALALTAIGVNYGVMNSKVANDLVSSHKLSNSIYAASTSVPNMY